MKIVTISREFGSGGRELGKRLADRLGFRYYDREILTALAEKSALDEGYVESALEKGLAAAIPLTFGASFACLPQMPHDAGRLLRAQQEIVRALPQHGDCVVVGRNADVLLGEHRPLKLFVYAGLEAKLARCQARAAQGEDTARRTLEKKIRQVDKARASYHALLSGRAWGDKAGYHLCLDTTGLSLKELSGLVAGYADYWFRANGLG